MSQCLTNDARLRMTRGDTFAFAVRMEMPDGSPLPFADGDTLYFTVKAAVGDEAIAIQKIVTSFEQDGSAAIVLEPGDTKKLPYGHYVYDLEWVRAGAVNTIVPCSTLVLGKEVTDNAVL